MKNELSYGFCKCCQGTGMVGALQCGECDGLGLHLTEEGVELKAFILRVVNWKRDFEDANE